MKSIKGEELDEFFKSGLASGVNSEVDEDWGRMKLMLIKNNRRKRIAGIIIISSGIAAMLLISSVVFFDLNTNFKEGNTGNLSQSNTENVLPEPKKLHENTIDPRTKSPSATAEQSISGMAVTPKHSSSSLTSSGSGLISKVGPSPEQLLIARELTPVLTDDSIPDQPLNTDVLANVNDPEKNYALVEPVVDSTSTSKRDNEQMSRFSIGLSIAQDFTGVNSLSNARTSNIVGLSTFYKLSDVLAIEAAVGYGKKVYGTEFSNYRPNSSYVFRVQPVDVSAICEVMDLQINMSYLIADRERSSFLLSAGLSSYLMLKENYHFYYANQLNRGPRRYLVKNQNEHLFGVANISFSYQQKLLNNIRLSFNPYVKIPLTRIGYGNVNLKSAGLSIGVISNFKTNP